MAAAIWSVVPLYPLGKAFCRLYSNPSSTSLPFVLPLIVVVAGASTVTPSLRLPHSETTQPPFSRAALGRTLSFRGKPLRTERKRSIDKNFIPIAVPPSNRPLRSTQTERFPYTSSPTAALCRPRVCPVAPQSPIGGLHRHGRAGLPKPCAPASSGASIGPLLLVNGPCVLSTTSWLRPPIVLRLLVVPIGASTSTPAHPLNDLFNVLDRGVARGSCSRPSGRSHQCLRLAYATLLANKTAILSIVQFIVNHQRISPVAFNDGSTSTEITTLLYLLPQRKPSREQSQQVNVLQRSLWSVWYQEEERLRSL